MRRLAAVLLLALLAGCSVGEADQSARSPQPAAPDPEASEADPGAPEDGAAPEAPDPHGELACDDPTRAAIDETIDSQLAAFADGDYERALTFASEGFREEFDVETFRQTIEEGFPLVADAVGHTSETCVRLEGDAQLLVTVESADGPTTELRYVMVLEGEDWRIAGAEPSGEGSEDPIEV